MTAIETLDDVYATLADRANGNEMTQQERIMLLHAAADVAFRKHALELIVEERAHRDAIGFGPVGAVLAR